MKNIYIVANWKANKTENEAILWLEEFSTKLNELTGQFEHKEVIICPPFSAITMVRKYIRDKDLPLKLGSQDISRFGRGAYTGEVPASILTNAIHFCIVGHSERRQNFSETDEILEQKVSIALSSNLMPIFCVQGKDTFIPENVKIVAYEPIEAIGTGHPDTPENADEVASQIKEKNKDVMYVLYGGSVTEENVKSFTERENIDGVLVGGASLDAGKFVFIIDKC